MKERTLGAGLVPIVAAAFLLGVAAFPGGARADTIIGDEPPPLPPEIPQSDAPPPLPTYFVAIGGQQVGPLTLPEITERIGRGEVSRASLVWTRGMDDWTAASEVGAVAALFAAQPGPDVREDSEEAEDVVVAPEFDPEAFVAGVWSNRTPLVFDELGETQGTLSVTYSADRRIAGGGTLVVNVPNLGPTELEIDLGGTWSVSPVSPASFMLTTNVDMTLNVPVLGHSESESSSDTGLVVVIDDDTIRDSEGVTWARR